MIELFVDDLQRTIEHTKLVRADEKQGQQLNVDNNDDDEIYPLDLDNVQLDYLCRIVCIWRDENAASNELLSSLFSSVSAIVVAAACRNSVTSAQVKSAFERQVVFSIRPDLGDKRSKTRRDDEGEHGELLSALHIGELAAEQRDHDKAFEKFLSSSVGRDKKGQSDAAKRLKEKTRLQREQKEARRARREERQITAAASSAEGKAKVATDVSQMTLRRHDIASMGTGASGSLDLRLEKFDVSAPGVQLLRDAELLLAAGRHYCLDEDMQVLTSRGFMFRDEVLGALASDAALLVASYDEDRDALVYERPIGEPTDLGRRQRTYIELTKRSEAIHWGAQSDEYGYNGEGSASNGSGLSFCVTGGHDMYVQKCTLYDRKPRDDRPAEAGPKQELYIPKMQREAGFSKVKARELLSDDPKAGILFKTIIGNGVADVRAPIFPCRRAAAAAIFTRIPFLRQFGFRAEQANTFLELYGYWLGAGLLAPHRGGGGQKDALAFAPAKEVDVRFVADSLKALGLRRGADYTHCKVQLKNDKGERIDKFQHRLDVFKTSWVRAFFDQYVSKYDTSAAIGYGSKRQPSRALEPHEQPPVYFASKSAKWCWFWVWQLDRGEVRCVLDGLTLADGNLDTRAIYTSSPTFRDEVVRMHLHAGHSCNWRMLRRAGAVRGSSDSGEPAVANLDRWQIHVVDAHSKCKSHFLHRSTEVSRVVKEGEAWCLSMPKGTLIARRAHSKTITDANGQEHRVATKASRAAVVGNCLIGRNGVGKVC
jgi:hypothetical protein